MTDLTFEQIRPSAHDVLRLALEQARLPTDDIDEPNRAFFRLADSAGPIGFVGLEGPERISFCDLSSCSRPGDTSVSAARWWIAPRAWLGWMALNACTC